MSVSDLMDGMMADVQAVLGRTVTLRAVSAGGTFNATTGARARTETDYANLVAVAGPIAQRRDSGLLIEDRAYAFAAADLPNGVFPRERWHVVDGGDIRPIVRVEKEADGRVYKAYTRVERKLGA